MPKNTQKKSKGTHKSHAVQKTPGIVAGVSAFLQRTAQGRFGAVVSNLAKYTRSGVVTMGSAAWYIVVTAMVIVFPIRRAGNLPFSSLSFSSFLFFFLLLFVFSPSSSLISSFLVSIPLLSNPLP